MSKARSNPFEKVPSVDEATLVCKLGDQLFVVNPAITEDGEPVEVGSMYVVVSRSGYGWDFRLVAGGGANQVRVLNSKVLSIFQPQKT